MTCILAFFWVLVLLVQAFLHAQVADFEALLLRQHIKTETQVEKGLHGGVDIAAILASDSTLQFPIERLVNNALASLLIATF